jgi:recombinational DNA repair protein (RecF pathway)
MSDLATCANCGEPLPPAMSGVGRPRKYCEAASCRTRRARERQRMHRSTKRALREYSQGFEELAPND